MNYRWQFDRDFLIRTINDFKIQLLNSSAISSKKREEMQATIEEFSFFLDVLDGNKIKNDFDFDILQTFARAARVKARSANLKHFFDVISIDCYIVFHF